MKPNVSNASPRSALSWNQNHSFLWGASENTVEMISGLVTLTHLGHNLILPHVLSSSLCSSLGEFSSTIFRKRSMSLILDKTFWSKKKHVFHVCWFPTAAINFSYHKLNAFKQCKYVVLWIRSTEVGPRSWWANITVSSVFCSFPETSVASPFPCLFQFPWLETLCLYFQSHPWWVMPSYHITLTFFHSHAYLWLFCLPLHSENSCDHFRPLR